MKKNLIKVTIILSMLLLTVIPLSVSAMSGNGTEESPFLITTEEELLLVTDFPDCHFKLANDIVMSEAIKTPICYESENGTFLGVFDGNGHTISNVGFGYDISKISLFNKNQGVIKNLNVEGLRLSMNGLTVSGIVDENLGNIINCTVKDVSGIESAYGIARLNSGTISECTVSGIIWGQGDNAGISYENSGIIEKCTVTAAVVAEWGSITGICYQNKSKIENCCFLGDLSNVNAADDHVNTVAGVSVYNGGWNGVDGNIKNCLVVATFNNATNIYPIACNYSNSNSTMENCYYDKTVSGLSTTTYGTPKSTSAMKMIQTYQTNWDFDTVWGIDSNINNGYPYLLWEYAPTDNQITFDTETQKAKIYLKEAGTYTVIFADYDGTIFKEANIQPLTLKQGYNSIPTTLTLTNGDKVFLWKDLKTLVPICEVLEISSK